MPTPSQSARRLPSPRVFTAGRRWLYRFLAFAGLPLLVFGIMEAVLRLVGYGYPTSFFIQKQINGAAVLVENSQFGLRFFPPSLVRTPVPVVMRAQKPAGVYRIFLFGESAALGDPRPAYGVGRYLEVLLRDRYAGMDFEVVCTAMTAINSHAILPVAHECARYHGDLWIVYMGNNEFVGPFGANTVFGPQAPPSAFVRAYLGLERTRTGQMITGLARQLTQRSSEPSKWRGMRMFLEHQLSPTDPRKARVAANFRDNLTDIVQAGLRAGVPVILSSVASNLKDCAPFGSLHPPGSSQTALKDWERLCQAGKTNADQGRWKEAAEWFRQAAHVSPDYAEVQFRLGQCFLAMTNLAEAKRDFELARDDDSLPFRADSQLNGIIKETAQEYAGKGVFYVDAVKALTPVSAGGIPGKESLYEHVHLNFSGNYWLARGFADVIAARLPERAAKTATSAWASPEECGERLGLTEWNRSSVLEEVARRLADAPFTNQFNHAVKQRELAGQLAESRSRLQRSAYRQARSIYEAAIEKRPQDPWLHQNYADFLTATGDLDEAMAQMKDVRDRLPYHHAAYIQLGRLLARKKLYGEARQSLAQALRLRPELADAHLELGQILVTEGKLKEALKECATALSLSPDDVATRLLKAHILVEQDQRGGATQILREAIAIQPSSWEARYLLGIELAIDGRFPEAQVQFEEVVRLRPNHAQAHFNLGIALARQQRFAEALTHLQEAVRLDPKNEQAQELLGRIQQLMPNRPAP